MTAIIIGIGMNPYKLMMKTSCKLVMRIGFVVDPKRAIVNQLTQFYRYTISINVNVLSCTAIFTRPAPDIAIRTRKAYESPAF